MSVETDRTISASGERPRPADAPNRIHIPAARQPQHLRTNDKAPLPLIAGWPAAIGYVYKRHARTKGRAEPAAEVETSAPASIFAPQIGLRSKISAYRGRRRLNRTFRRNQREFDRAVDAVAHDPAGQRELTTSWTLRP